MSLYLAKGQRSNSVLALQNALNMTLLPTKFLELDGIFGPLTYGATRQFQKRKCLADDGIAGPKTLGALFEGTEAETTITISAAESGTPYQTPATRDYAPFQDATPSISFGAYGSTYGLFNRELQIHNWIIGDCPKKKLELLPPRPYLYMPFDLDAMERRGVPVYRPPQGTRNLSVSNQKSIALDAKVEMKDFKKFEYKFKISTFQPIAWGFLKPSVELIPSPDGSLSVKTEIKVKTFSILDADGKSFSFKIEPLLTTSATLPLVYGVGTNPYPGLKFFGGGQAKLHWNATDRTGFFVGVKAGVETSFKFKQSGIEIGTVFPVVPSGGVEIRF